MEPQQISKRNMLVIISVLLLLLAQRAVAHYSDTDRDHADPHAIKKTAVIGSPECTFPTSGVRGQHVDPRTDLTRNFTHYLPTAAHAQALLRISTNPRNASAFRPVTGEEEREDLKEVDPDSEIPPLNSNDTSLPISESGRRGFNKGTEYSTVFYLRTGGVVGSEPVHETAEALRYMLDKQALMNFGGNSVNERVESVVFSLDQMANRSSLTRNQTIEGGKTWIG